MKKTAEETGIKKMTIRKPRPGHSTTAKRGARVSTSQKHVQLTGMLRDLRSDAESLLDDAKHLLTRLS